MICIHRSGSYSLLGSSCFPTGTCSAGRLWLALLFLALSAALSTFTMASVLLLAGVGIFFLGTAFLRRSRHRWLMVFASTALVIFVVFAVSLLRDQSDSLRFVYDKTIRLYEGVTERGFVNGEQTGRAMRFVNTFGTFCDNPLAGVGFSDRDGYVGMHSSFIDHWAQYGLLGYMPWFLLQMTFTFSAFRNLLVDRRNVSALGSAISWLLYWGASVGNPTAFSLLPAMLAFTDCQSSQDGEARRALVRPPTMECGRRMGCSTGPKDA